jgi:hypothetical protein
MRRFLLRAGRAPRDYTAGALARPGLVSASRVVRARLEWDRPQWPERGVIAQEEVEEIEHIAENRSGNDLPLIDRQPLLPLQELQHRFLPISPATRPEWGEQIFASKGG